MFTSLTRAKFRLDTLLEPEPTGRLTLVEVLENYAVVLRSRGDPEGAAELELEAAELRK